MSETLANWVESHKSDYAAVSERLNAVRNVVMYGTLKDAADVLEKSYMFAVLSIQTECSRHESAFVGHYTGDLTCKEAALETVYGGHKSNWMARTFENNDFKQLVQAVRSHAKNGRWATLLDVMTDNVVGVAERKASFMLAMCGFTEFMCIDSNVGRYGGIDADTEFYSAEAYFDACETIREKSGIDGFAPFLVQWAIYDFERGEHARHMIYFNEVLK